MTTLFENMNINGLTFLVLLALPSLFILTKVLVKAIVVSFKTPDYLIEVNQHNKQVVYGFSSMRQVTAFKKNPLDYALKNKMHIVSVKDIA